MGPRPHCGDGRDPVSSDSLGPHEEDLMQSYLCPSCGGTTEADLHRFVWCVHCGQPLTIVELAPRAAPALAATTSTIAASSRARRSWPSTTKPASAASAGSRLISTPKTASGSRRSDSSSSE